jgi:hypothetical protein
MVEAIDWIWEGSWKLNGAWLKLAEFIIYSKNRTINVAKNQVKIRPGIKKLKKDLVSTEGTTPGFLNSARGLLDQFTIVEKISLKHFIIIRF